MSRALSTHGKLRSLILFSTWFFLHLAVGSGIAVAQSGSVSAFSSGVQHHEIAITGDEPAGAMVLVFDTQARGQSRRTVTLPLRGNVNVTIDWGDGTEETVTDPGDVNYTYAQDDVYMVTITGDLEQFGAGQSRYLNAERLIGVTSFGELGLKSLSGAFTGASNLTKVPAQVPGTVTDMSFMFFEASRFNGVNVRTWNVGAVTNMADMFNSAEVFNQDIGSWDVSNVTDMSNMFANAINFDQNLGDWDVAGVLDMSGMFRAAVSFNQDIGGWQVDNVSNMFRMFSNASSFNQDISSWEVGGVSDMGVMFFNATAFNQDLSRWNVSSVLWMDRMFEDATSFDQSLAAWDVSSVQFMNDMFMGVTLSTHNYSKMLISWSGQNIQHGVEFHGGDSRFFLGEALAGRSKMIDLNRWEITDGGLELPSQTVYHMPSSILRGEPFTMVTEFRDTAGNRYEYDGEVSIHQSSAAESLEGALLSNANKGLVFFENLVLKDLGIFEFRIEINYLDETGSASTFVSDQTSSPVLVTTLYSGGHGRGDVVKHFTDLTLAGEEVMLWLGGTNGLEQDWFTHANWRKNRVPGEEEFILIATGDYYPVISGDEERNVNIKNRLNLRGNAKITLQPGPSLTISEGARVLVEEQGDTGAPAFVLKSGARFVDRSGERPLLEMHRQLGPELVGTHIAGANKGWRMIASPLNTDYGDFTDEIVTQGFPNADHPEANSADPEVFSPNLLWWDETGLGAMAQGWRTLNHDEEGTYDIELSDIAVPAGRGHIYYNFDGANLPDQSAAYQDALPLFMVVKGREHEFANDNGTMRFTYGYENGGMANFPLTSTDREHSDQLQQTENQGKDTGMDAIFINRIQADQGWNLLGNPTASALVWDPEENENGAWSVHNLDHTIYVWDPSANNGAGDYLIWNGTIGSLTDNRIAPFQAFWVKASGSNPSLSFTNAAKTTDTYSFVGGGSENSDPPELSPKHSGDTQNDTDQSEPPVDNSETMHSEVVAIQLAGAGMNAKNWLMFSEAGTKSYDRYDAFRLEPLEDTWISTATTMEVGGPSLVINSLPKEFPEILSLPFYVGAARDGVLYDGEFELNWTIPENWHEERAITLMDHERRVSIDMLRENEYRFTHATEVEMASKAIGFNSRTEGTQEDRFKQQAEERPQVAFGLPEMPRRIAFSGPEQVASKTMHNSTAGTGSQKPDSAPDDFHSTSMTTSGGVSLPRFTIVLSSQADLPYITFDPTLQPNYPNPFNSLTTIPFTLPYDKRVRIDVFDILGRKVATLVDSQVTGGLHEVRWDATRSASGVYIVRMVTDQGAITQKVTLVK